MNNDLAKASQQLSDAMVNFAKVFVEQLKPVVKQLRDLGYIDDKGNLTEKGQALVDEGKK